MPNPLILLLSVLLAALTIVTVWSVYWDVSAYRAWKAELDEPQPRWKRRQQDPEARETEAKRWRWIILALQCSLFCFVSGAAAVGAGMHWRIGWLLVSGGNLLFLGLVTWIGYNLVLPKPEGLKKKTLPNWLRGSGGTQGS